MACGINVADQRGTVLEVMQCTHDLFVEHGVTYFLDYGSLLGAIRHKVRTTFAPLFLVRASLSLSLSLGCIVTCLKA